MQFFAFLIAAISVSIAALMLKSSDEIAVANVPLLDLPLSGLSSSNSMTPGNKPSSFSFNSDIVSFQIPDILESTTLSPNSAREPSSNSADQPPVLNPSTIFTEVQAYTDDSNPICPLHSNTGRKRKERQSCIDLSQFLILPPVDEQKQDDGTQEQREKYRVFKNDIQWNKDHFQGMTQEQRDNEIRKLAAPGSSNCANRDGEVYPFPFCCLGPSVYITVPTLPNEVNLMNVFNCVLFLLGRPYCNYGGYCCKKGEYPELGRGRGLEWLLGFKGIECIAMP